jgi:hypothetical protein
VSLREEARLAAHREAGAAAAAQVRGDSSSTIACGSIARAFASAL